MKATAILLLAACLALPVCGCAKRVETFIFSLPCNPTTGYDWVLSEVTGPGDWTGRVNVQLAYVPDKAPEGFVGVGGSTVVTVTGETPGETAVRLCYVRGWEWDGDPASAEGVAVYGFEVHKNLSLTLTGSETILPESMRGAEQAADRG